MSHHCHDIDMSLNRGKGYSHCSGANKDNFFIIRTPAVLHSGANKQNFPIIHTIVVRIRDLSQSLSVIRNAMNQKFMLLFNIKYSFW